MSSSSSEAPSEGQIVRTIEGEVLLRILLALVDGVEPPNVPAFFQLTTDHDRRGLMERILNDHVHWHRLLNGYIKLGAEPTRDWLFLVHRAQESSVQTAFVRFLERVYQSPRMVCDGAKLIGMFELFIQNQENVNNVSASDLNPDAPQFYFYQTHGTCPRPPIDHLTEMLKCLTSGPRFNSYHISVVYKMIDMLVAKGAIIDLYQNRFIKQYPEINPNTKKIPDNAVEIAMMPQCPVSFLHTLLSTQRHEEQRFTRTSPTWRAPGPDLPRGMHFAVTNVEWIVTRIFQDLFDENKYVGPSVCMRHEYGQKLKLLLNPGWTDLTEFNALRQLLDVVEEIEPLFEDDISGELRKSDAFTAQVWFKLCRAVAGLADAVYQAECDRSTRDFGNRRHRFVIDKSWNPRIQWMEGEFEKHISDANSGLVEVLNHNLKNVWQSLIVERGGAQLNWWEIEEQDKWYVSADEVERVIRGESLYGVSVTR